MRLFFLMYGLLLSWQVFAAPPSDANLTIDYETIKYAIMDNDDQAVATLLKDKVDIDSLHYKGFFGESNGLIHLAALSGNNLAIDKLLAKGADINQRNNQGNTALHLAIRNEHESTVKWLLSKQAKVNLLNAKGNTPWDFAQEIDNGEIADYLEQAGGIKRNEELKFESRLFDKKIISYQKNTNKFSHLAVDPNGQYIITGLNDGNKVAVYDLESSKLINRLEPNDEPLIKVFFNSQLNTAILVHGTYLVIYNFSSQAIAQRIPLSLGFPINSYTKIDYNAARNTLIFNQGSTIKLLDLQHPEVENTLVVNGVIKHLGFNAPGDKLFVVDASQVLIYKLDSKSLEHSITMSGNNFLNFDNQLLINHGGINTQGLNVSVVNSDGKVVNQFNIKQAFQSYDARIQRTRNNNFYIESFDTIVSFDLSGNSYKVAFDKFTFSDFAFHPKKGVVFLNENEIQRVDFNGFVKSRILPDNGPVIPEPSLAVDSQTWHIKADHPTKGFSVVSSYNATEAKVITGGSANILAQLKHAELGSAITVIDVSNQYIAIGYADGSYSVWDSQDFSLISMQKKFFGHTVSAMTIDDFDLALFVGTFGRFAKISLLDDNDISIMRGHGSYISAMAISDDSTLLITAGSDQMLRFWSTSDGTLLANFPLKKGWLDVLQVSGEKLIGKGPGITQLRLDLSPMLDEITNPETRLLVQTPNTTVVSKFVFSPDNSMMANINNSLVKVWDIKTGLLLTQIFPKQGFVNDLAFTVDNKNLVIAAGDALEYWDPISGQFQKRINLGTNGYSIHHLNSVGDRNLLLMSNMHGWHNPIFIHGSSSSPVAQLRYELTRANIKDNIIDLTISKSGKYIATYGGHRIKVFELGPKHYELIFDIPRVKKEVTNQYWKKYLGFSEDETLLNFISFEESNYTIVYDIASKQEVFKKRGKLSTFLDGKRLIYMDSNTSLAITDLAKPDPTQLKNIKKIALPNHNELVSALAYNSKEQMIVVADIWGNTSTWDARSGAKIRATNRWDFDIYHAELSPDKKHLAYNNKSGIHIMNLESMEHTRLDGDNYPFYGVFSPKGKHFYYRKGAEYHQLKLSSMKSSLAFETEWKKEKTTGADITSDGQHMMFKIDSDGLNEDKYYIYNLTSHQLVKTFDESTEWPAEAGFLSVDNINPLSQIVQGFNIKISIQSEQQTQNNEPKSLTIVPIQFDYKNKKIRALSTAIKAEVPDNNFNQYILNRNIKLTKYSNQNKYFLFAENISLTLVDLETGKSLFTRYRDDIEHVAFDQNDEHMLLFDSYGYVEKYKLATLELVSRFKVIDSEISSVQLVENTLMVLGTNEIVKLFDLNTDKEIVSLAMRGKDDFLIVNPQGYYFATKGASQMGVAFRKGGKVYPFEQFDLIYNQPHKAFLGLVERGITSALVSKVYKKAFEKRLLSHGFSLEDSANIDSFNIPELVLEKQSLPVYSPQRSLPFTYSAKAPKGQLSRLNVWVNNVPVYGVHGKEITGGNITETLSLELSSGANKVQFSVHNEQGVESLKETAQIYFDHNNSGKTHLIVIGADKYQQNEMNLNFAAKDAGDFADMLTDSNTTVYKLTDSQVNLKQIRLLKDKLLQTHTDDRVILFYAGHGILNSELDYYLGTYDIDFAAPDKRGLSYTELETLFDKIPSRNRLMLIDACHSGEVDKSQLAELQLASKNDEKLTVRSFANARGIKVKKVNKLKKSSVNTKPVNTKPVDRSFKLNKALFSDIRKGTGITVISASGSAEFAYEYGELKNGVFTYSLIQGLKEGLADLNNDDAIQITELQHFVKDKVYKLTSGQQQPTFRVQNIENDWSVLEY